MIHLSWWIWNYLGSSSTWIAWTVDIIITIFSIVLVILLLCFNNGMRREK